MKASILDLRRNMPDVLSALDRGETVTITYRGKDKGVMYPVAKAERKSGRLAEHPTFGIWRDRDDLHDVDQFVRNLRKPRHAL